MNTIWHELMGLPFRQSFYDANGIRTRALEAGEGKPLIFLHGTGGHAEAYVRNLAAHAEHFHVYSIDMVGHGYTDKPDLPYGIPDFVDHLTAFIDAIGAEKAMVSGESLGGIVAAWLAIGRPDRVEKLVLNTGILVPPPEEGRKQLRDVLERSRAAAGNLTRDTVRKRLEWLMHDPADVTDELVEVRYRIYSQPGTGPIIGRISQSILGGSVDDDWAKRWLDPAKLGDISCPTLVLWARHNPGQPVAVAEQAAKRIPRAKLVVLEDCAHWPQWEQAEKFNQAHLEFLRAA
jgi:2-hydroxy-6-oxonona-2,4-dienedioate hydrolase